jgi:hypothetical protein
MIRCRRRAVPRTAEDGDHRALDVSLQFTVGKADGTVSASRVQLFEM